MRDTVFERCMCFACHVCMYLCDALIVPNLLHANVFLGVCKKTFLTDTQRTQFTTSHFNVHRAPQLVRM